MSAVRLAASPLPETQLLLRQAGDEAAGRPDVAGAGAHDRGQVARGDPRDFQPPGRPERRGEAGAHHAGLARSTHQAAQPPLRQKATGKQHSIAPQRRTILTVSVASLNSAQIFSFQQSAFNVRRCQSNWRLVLDSQGLQVKQILASLSMQTSTECITCSQPC